jgi:predicted Zn-dependent protease
MSGFKLFPKVLLCTAAAACCLGWIGIATPLAAQSADQDQEVQMGQEVFNELKAKGEIIESSPLYDQLKPIADAITRSAQPRYNHPFKFYLVHEQQPNAFATPGGNVYVVDSLLYFVKNTDQLAGTLCHEVSHTIHHDTVTLIEKEQRLEKREVGAAILLGPTRAHVLAILLLGKLHSLSYSRDVESRADLTGSDVCAATGYPMGTGLAVPGFRQRQDGTGAAALIGSPRQPKSGGNVGGALPEEPECLRKIQPGPKVECVFCCSQGCA